LLLLQKNLHEMQTVPFKAGTTLALVLGVVRMYEVVRLLIPGALAKSEYKFISPPKFIFAKMS